MKQTNKKKMKENSNWLLVGRAHDNKMTKMQFEFLANFILSYLKYVRFFSRIITKLHIIYRKFIQLMYVFWEFKWNLMVKLKYFYYTNQTNLKKRVQWPMSLITGAIKIMLTKNKKNKWCSFFSSSIVKLVVQ